MTVNAVKDAIYVWTYVLKKTWRWILISTNKVIDRPDFIKAKAMELVLDVQCAP